MACKIQYLKEQKPLDTAGCLGLVDPGREPFLVMNGDLLTTLDFGRLLTFHRTQQPLATIATYRRQVKIDLGVLESDDQGRLIDYIEKPTYDFSVSMGVYCFDPAVCRYVQAGERVSMPELMLRLRDAGEPILCYREDCYWLDIGRPDDYARAIEDFRGRSDAISARRANMPHEAGRTRAHHWRERIQRPVARGPFAAWPASAPGRSGSLG